MAVDWVNGKGRNPNAPMLPGPGRRQVPIVCLPPTLRGRPDNGQDCG